MGRARWLSTSGGATPAARHSAARTRRRVRAAAPARPLPADRPGAGRHRPGPALAADPGGRLLVPELRPAADHRRLADPVGGAGQLQPHLRRSRVLAVAAHHGAVRGRGRAADADHRHAGRPAAAPARQEDGRVRQHRGTAGLGHSPGRGQRAVLLAVQPRRRAGRLDAQQDAALAGRQHRLGRASTGRPAAPCPPTRC